MPVFIAVIVSGFLSAVVVSSMFGNDSARIKKLEREKNELEHKNQELGDALLKQEGISQ